MNVIETNEAAKIVAEDIRHFVLTNEDLRCKCKGECSVVIGLEPLCREACKRLKADKLSVKLGEARIKFPTRGGIAVDYSRRAYSGLYACVLNSHANAIKSSYDPSGRPGNAANRRGCLGFDVTKMRKFFKKEKNWARYYVAVQVGGVTDDDNELFARRGTKLLCDVIEELKLVPDNRPVEETSVYAKAKKQHEDRVATTVEIVLVTD